MKKWIFLGILALIGVGIAVFVMSFEMIVKKVVHKYGSQVTQTDVSLEGFKLSLTSGEGRIQRLTVANPEGYKMPYLFELAEIYVKVDVNSLTTNTIVIEKIEVKNPVITYEMKSVTQNNISDIQKNIASFGSSAPKKEEAPKEKEAAKSSEPGKQVVIRSIVINDGQLNALTALQDDKTKASVKFPSVTLTGIGEEKKGTSVVEATTKILTEVLRVASKTVVDSGLNNLKDIAKENLNNVVDGVKDRVGVKGLFGK